MAMAYPDDFPSRGAWRFRNVTGAFDFQPTLESIQITQSNPEDVATFSCTVKDEDNTLVFNVEDKVWVTFDGTRIFAGHVKVRVRGQADETGPRQYQLECQDYTAKLDDSIITRKKDRKQETIRKRLRWIYSHLNYGMELDLSGVPSDESIPAANYHGMSTLEAFEQVADERNLFMEVDFDEDADGTPTLSFFRTITAVATFDLDNEAPDFSSTFPYREFQDQDDSSDLATMVYVIPEDQQDAAWVVSTTQRATWGWQQSSFTDASIKGPNGVERIGGRFLDEFDQPLTEGSCVVHQPGLKSGQKIHIVNALWGLDYDRYITSVVITALDPHDNAGEAYLKSEITFNDRRKTRRRPSRPSQGDTAVPTDPEPVIDFPTPTDPPTQSDGDPITLTWAGRMQHSRDPHDVTIYNAPAWTSYSSGTTYWLTSHLQGYTSWPSRLPWQTCPGTLDNAFAGMVESEQWMSCTMPAIPAGAASIEFDMPISSTSGGVQGPSYASIGAVEIVASATQPASMREGTVIGIGYLGQTVTVNVPVDLLPAEGEELYVGYRTGWHATGVEDPYAYVCGFHWPFMSVSYLTDNDGAPWGGYSGRIRVGASSVVGTWKIWDGAAPDLGDTSSGYGIQDGGSTGDPTAWSIGSDGITVSDDAPASKSVYFVAANEDADEPFAPWSDGAWGARIYFTIDGHGDTTDAGTRAIQLTTISNGEKSIGTVHMGDAQYAEGISVAGPAAPDFEAAALTDGELMVAMFDTRNQDQIRGKIWVAGEGEPTEWVTFSDLTATEDTQDRVQLFIGAGNDGTTQGVTVHRVDALDGAAPGERVVGAFLGFAGGSEKTFYVPDKYKPGSLRVLVNGIVAKTYAEDGEATSFQLDWWPTAGSSIVVDYVGAGGAD